MLIARHHFQLKAKRKKEKRTELSYDLYYVWNEAEKMKKKKKKIVDGDERRRYTRRPTWISQKFSR
jgi:hypothetical protein